MLGWVDTDKGYSTTKRAGVSSFNKNSFYYVQQFQSISLSVVIDVHKTLANKIVAK